MTARPRPFSGHHLALIAASSLLLAACATVPDAGPHRGTSGAVAWEVTDIVRRVSADGESLRWRYTVVLKETTGSRIRFEQVDRTTSGRMLHTGSHRMERIDRQLDPHGELRFHYVDTLGWAAGDAPFGGARAHGAITAVWRYSGTDDKGATIAVTVPVTLDPTTGRSARRPPDDPLPPPRMLRPDEVQSLAGEWSGHYRDPGGFDIPWNVIIRVDGSFDATEDEPPINRFRGAVFVRDGKLTVSAGQDSGDLTIHEGGRSRFLAGTITGLRGSTTVSHPVRLEQRGKASTQRGIAPETGGRTCPASNPIKGYVSSQSGELIYYVPGGRFYDTAKPVRCYASEEDARQDGAFRAREERAPQ